MNQPAYDYTWEEAVAWLRAQPDQQALVRACYFDDPILDAANRFWQSQEWKLIREFFPRGGRSALDLGAGRGISSFALARDGWKVTAVEPDPSLLVGAGAIRQLNEVADLDIHVVTENAETLPLPEDMFDLANCRQVLHHARDLKKTCRELYRVLKPGGVMVATREHVISQRDDLHRFLEKHPLHHLYGGENAYLLTEYTQAITSAGFRIRFQLGPFDSAINYFPMTEKEWVGICTKPLSKIIGRTVTEWLFSRNGGLGDVLVPSLAKLVNWKNQTPGRLYTFVAEKPA